MQETNLKLIQAQITKEERARRLAQAYAAILAWPDPREITAEPTDANLGGGTAGSAIQQSAIADTKQPLHPVDEEQKDKGV